MSLLGALVIRRGFSALRRRPLTYTLAEGAPAEPRQLPGPGTAVFIVPSDYHRRDPVYLEPGDPVQTGQRLALAEGSPHYATSSVTGEVVSLAPYTGEFGQPWCNVTVATASEDQASAEFAEDSTSPTPERILRFLRAVPGCPAPTVRPVTTAAFDTLLISASDPDLLVTTQQHTLARRPDAIREGIGILREAVGANQVILAVPEHLEEKVPDLGADVRPVAPVYPAALPALLCRDLLGRVVPAGRRPIDVGILILSVEAAASVGTAFAGDQVPFRKALTVVARDGTPCAAEAHIGTPVREVLAGCGIEVTDGDRILLGGPMTGSSIPTPDHPLEATTDAIVVQGRDQAPASTDAPCVNCGECVRVCPARMPVNLLVRLLEHQEYREAADRFALHCCIECGLCSYVCPARMPVFQYIKLARHVLADDGTTEAPHG